MTTKITEDLEKQIERLVREHLEIQRRAAATAVERAFGCAKPARPAQTRSTSGRRRAAAELAELGERLCDAVRANPGETMATIAAHVGERPRALNRPMEHLRRAGKVRSAGERNHTRYFPMTAAKSA